MESRCFTDPENNKDENKVVKWSNLPRDILSLVAAKLIIKDQIRLSSVCRGWQPVCNEVRRKHALRSLPFLLFPTQEQGEDEDTTDLTCSLYSLEDNKLCDFRFSLPLPHRYWLGSSFGWLVTITVAGQDDQDAEITLLNPFFNQEINLPSLTTFQLAVPISWPWSDYFPSRAVVSASPSSNSNNCIVMAIYGQFRRLAFCSPVDKGWTTLSPKIDFMTDIIFYKDHFYAIDHDKGDLWVCDLVNLKLSKVARGPGSAEKRYLVESASTGELLLVLRQKVVGEVHNRIKSFDVFKFDFERRQWIRMHDHLQGCTVFVGYNTSLSLFTADYNNPLGCQPNSIYFVEDQRNMYHETAPENYQLHIGVYHFKDRYTMPHNLNHLAKYVPAPIWIERPQPSCEGQSSNVL